MIRFRQTVMVLASVVSTAGIFQHLHAAPSASVTTKLVSDHVFRGQHLSGVSLQPALDLSAGDFFGGISSNIPFENRSSGQTGGELDLYAAYRFALNTTTQLTPGVTAYFYRDAPVSAGNRRTVFEPSLALSHTLAGIRFTSTLDYDISRKGPILDLTADVALPLTKLGTEIDLAASVGAYRLGDTGDSRRPKTRMEGGYWSLSATVPLQITFHSKILIGLSYAGAFDTEIKKGSITRSNPLATRRLVGQLGYSYLF